MNVPSNSLLLIVPDVHSEFRIFHLRSSLRCSCPTRCMIPHFQHLRSSLRCSCPASSSTSLSSSILLLRPTLLRTTTHSSTLFAHFRSEKSSSYHSMVFLMKRWKRLLADILRMFARRISKPNAHNRLLANRTGRPRKTLYRLLQKSATILVSCFRRQTLSSCVFPAPYL